MSTQPGLSPAASVRPAQATSMTLILALGLMVAFGPLSHDMYLPAFPAIERELHASASLVQLSLTACMIGIALGQLIVGPISDQTGRRRPLIIGLAVYVVSSLLCAWAPSIIVFIAMRFIQGLSGAAGIVISRAISRDMFTGPALTKFSATLTAVFGVAPILGPIIGGQLIRFMSWQSIFYVLAGIAIVLLVYVLFGLKESLPEERRTTGGFAQTRRAFGGLFRDRFFLGLAFTQGFTSACMFAYISGSSFVLQNLHGISPQVYSLIFGINALGQIILAQVSGRMAGRVPERRMIGIGVGTSVFGATLVLVSVLTDAGLWLLLSGIFLSVASVGMVNTNSFSLAMTRYGHAAGTASALIGVLSFMIGGLLAPMVGLGGAEADLPMGLVMAGTSWVAVMCYGLLVLRSAKETAAS